MTAALTCIPERLFPVAVVRVRGRLGMETAPVVRRTFTKVQADQPLAIVVDATEMTLDEPLAVTVFAVVANAAAQWPGASLLICTADHGVRAALASLETTRRLPVFPDRATALAVAEQAPMPPRLREQLPRSVDAPRIARDAVQAACANWGVLAASGPGNISG